MGAKHPKARGLRDEGFKLRSAAKVLSLAKRLASLAAMALRWAKDRSHMRERQCSAKWLANRCAAYRTSGFLRNAYQRNERRREATAA